MSSQRNCVIAEPKATWYGISRPVAAVKLPVRGRLASRDRERWSG
jgi:hypothetical protein